MKRYFSAIALFFCFIIIVPVNWLCLMLDKVFYPGFRKIPFPAPVFIIGMPRSATTLCFNLLNENTREFTSMKLWEILLAPSILQKKLFQRINRWDSRINHPLYKFLRLLDKSIFRATEHVHPISLFNHEEDDYLFTHLFSTISFSFLFPGKRRFEVLARFDTEVSPARKKRMMNFYNGCIRRHMYVFGKGRHYLAKSPAHTPKINTLSVFFPGGRFLYMLRDPLYAISSSISLFREFRKLFIPSVDLEFIINKSMTLADHWYHYPLCTCSCLVNKSVFVIQFHELISNPIETLKEIHRNLGIDFPVDFENTLRQNSQKIRSHKNNHFYSPGEFNLHRELMVKRYGYVYNLFPDLEQPNPISDPVNNALSTPIP